MVSPVKIWRNQQKISDMLGCIGQLITWTLVRMPPEGFADQAPYVVGIIACESGEKISVQIVDCEPENLKKGMSIRLIIRRVREADPDGIIPYGLKGVPVKSIDRRS
jgi:uncharacterized OB-fold protein